MNTSKTIVRTAAAALVMLAVFGCRKHNTEEVVNPNRRVLLFYECAFNDIGSFMKTNMEDQNKGLPAGYIPSKSDNVLLVYSRISNGKRDYTPVKSYLRRIYRNSGGKMVSDTLKVFDSGTIAASPSTVRNVLTFVKEKFPAKGYGMVFSSHGSGWLPAGYYFSPTQFEAGHKNEISAAAARNIALRIAETPRLPVPEGSLSETDPFWGKMRSVGQDFIEGSYYGHEMSISEFAGAIPFHLDYILFDMCFTGGVEVAYGLKDKTDYLGLSPAEVLGDGMFDYTKITSFLIGGNTPDLEGLFKDSFEMYDSQSGLYRSSTVNLVRTDGLDNLAAVCGRLIEEYPDAIATAQANDIQGYFRSGRHYFYDLADIFKECGAKEEDLDELDGAINGCVVYRNATPRFMDTFDIVTYSGFSMYLPCAGTALLDSYYKKEAWNEAVGLVK